MLVLRIYYSLGWCSCLALDLSCCVLLMVWYKVITWFRFYSYTVSRTPQLVSLSLSSLFSSRTLGLPLFPRVIGSSPKFEIRAWPQILKKTRNLILGFSPRPPKFDLQTSEFGVEKWCLDTILLWRNSFSDFPPLAKKVATCCKSGKDLENRT